MAVVRGFGGGLWGERVGEGWEEVVERGEGGGEEWRGGLSFGREGGGGLFGLGGWWGLLLAGGAGSEGACWEESGVEWMRGREASRASSSAGMSNGSASGV